MAGEVEDGAKRQKAAQPAAEAPVSSGAASGPAPVARPADAMLGQVVWLMTGTPALKYAFITDLEWMVLPPILLGQCRMMYQNGRPVAFAAWASVSEEVEKRIEKLQMKLAPAEWRSGDRVWLVNIVAPFGHAEKMLKELKTTALAGKAFTNQSII